MIVLAIFLGAIFQGLSFPAFSVPRWPVPTQKRAVVLVSGAGVLVLDATLAAIIIFLRSLIYDAVLSLDRDEAVGVVGLGVWERRILVQFASAGTRVYLIASL